MSVRTRNEMWLGFENIARVSCHLRFVGHLRGRKFDGDSHFQIYRKVRSKSFIFETKKKNLENHAFLVQFSLRILKNVICFEYDIFRCFKMGSKCDVINVIDF